MASSKNQDLLMQIVQGQSALAQEVKTMNIRLFGGEGQQGALKFMYDKHEEHVREITACREKISMDIKEFHDKEVKPLDEKISELKTDSRVTMWRVGALTGLFGTGVGVGIEMLIKKVF